MKFRLFICSFLFAFLWSSCNNEDQSSLSNDPITVGNVEQRLSQLGIDSLGQDKIVNNLITNEIGKNKIDGILTLMLDELEYIPENYESYNLQEGTKNKLKEMNLTDDQIDLVNSVTQRLGARKYSAKQEQRWTAQDFGTQFDEETINNMTNKLIENGLQPNSIPAVIRSIDYTVYNHPEGQEEITFTEKIESYLVDGLNLNEEQMNLVIALTKEEIEKK